MARVIDAKFAEDGTLTFIGDDGSKLVSPISALIALAEKAKSLSGGPKLEELKNAPGWSAVTAISLEQARVLTLQTTQGETVLLNLSPGQSDERSYSLLPALAKELGRELVSVADSCQAPHRPN
jgi:hypothetical protein